jgi:hypothetical protein
MQLVVSLNNKRLQTSSNQLYVCDQIREEVDDNMIPQTS